MIVYDWNTLSRWDIKSILIVMHYLMTDLSTAPKRILKIIAEFKHCDSFLAKPENLVKLETRHTDEEIYQYLQLASLRSYTIYNQTGGVRLPTDYVRDTISNNRSLIIDKDEIIFKYEE